MAIWRRRNHWRNGSYTDNLGGSKKSIMWGPKWSTKNNSKLVYVTSRDGKDDS